MSERVRFSCVLPGYVSTETYPVTSLLTAEKEIRQAITELNQDVDRLGQFYRKRVFVHLHFSRDQKRRLKLGCVCKEEA